MKVAKSENRKEILLKDIFEDFNKDDTSVFLISLIIINLI